MKARAPQKRSHIEREEPQRLRFAAEIPGGAHGPLWKLNVEALSEPAPGGGEHLLAHGVVT